MLLLVKSPFFLLLLSTLFFASHGFSSLLHHQSITQTQTQTHSQGLLIRRHVIEETSNGTTGTLVLAAERTHRRDPTSNLEYYTGGWDIFNTHYVFSVAYSAAPLIGVAIAWFVLLGLFICYAFLCCCWCGKSRFGYSRKTYLFSLYSLSFFTLSAVIGCIILYHGEGSFYSSTKSIFTYVLQQARNIVTQVANLWTYLQSAKDLKLGNHNLLPDDIRDSIDKVGQVTQVVSNFPILSSNAMSKSVAYTVFLPVRQAFAIIVVVLLVVSVLGFLFSLCGLRFLVYIMVIIGWLIVTATFILAAVFLVFHNVVGDTCVAMQDWVHSPRAASSLGKILPCMDKEDAYETLNITTVVTSEMIKVSNSYINDVINKDLPPDAGPLYNNQSGPLLPLICNNFNSDLNTTQCKPGEVALSNATEGWKNYVCEATDDGICTTQGRLTPAMYEDLIVVANISYALNHFGPFLVSLVDCGLVYDTFKDIADNYCPSMMLTTQWIYLGLVIVSCSIMFSIIFWLSFVRERQHRMYTKKLMSTSSAILFERQNW